MKKIICGKMYNTETAKEVGTWDNGCYGSFNYCKETLYKKKTGEFFLYGEGGPRSTYSECVECNVFSSGDKIIPLTENQAKDWMEKKCDPDEYISVFGEVEE